MVRKINNQLFGRTFYTETKFSKIESSWWQNPVFCDKSFWTPRFIFLKIGFWRAVFYGNFKFLFVLHSTKKNSTSVFQKRLFVFCFLFFCVLFFCVYPVIVRKICPSLNPLKASLPSYRNESIDLHSRPLTGFYMRATLVLDGLNRLLL